MTDRTDVGEPATYADAEDELEQILRSLEADDVDVDELSAQVARARWLIDWCRSRLATAEVSISELLADPEDAADRDDPDQGAAGQDV